MADGSVRVVGYSHPLALQAPEREAVYALARAGQTITQILGEDHARTLKVLVGGQEVPATLWPRLKPKAGTEITVIAHPTGHSANKWLKLVVIMVAAYLAYTGNYTAAMKVLAYGFTIVNILVPPPQPKLPGQGDPFDPLQSLTGTQNRAAQYSPIPLVLGTVRFYPPHAALPYTEISGDDQYLRLLLDLGPEAAPGSMDVSDIKIGATPIDSYDDVEYEIGTNPSLFTQDVFELEVGTTLADGDVDTRTSQAGSTELSVDFEFPQGLYSILSKDGSFSWANAFVDIRFRQVGTTTWFGVADPTPGITLSSGAIRPYSLSVYKITSSANKALRVGVRWKVSAGQYEVQVTRNTSGWDGIAPSLTMIWTVLRSISPQLPSSTGTLKLAVRIKATDQLNGVVSTLSVLATQRIPTWDVATQSWTDPVATGNNAHIYAWLLTQCPAVARHVAQSRVDLDTLADWAASCDALGFAYNKVEDSGRTLFDILRDVLASGRATFGMRNGKYSCVRDVAQTVPVQLFSPANSWEFSGQRTFYDPPHALRCQWTNPEADGQVDELIVYAEGYSNATATRFEVMDLRVCTDPVAVWRLATYHLAAAKARANTYTLNGDVEHIVCERGDLVHVANDVVDWGLASGRVKAVIGNRLVLDGHFTPEDGKQYTIRVRRGLDGAQLAALGNPTITWDSTHVRFDMELPWDSSAAETNVLTLAAPIDVRPGDLYVLGDVVGQEVAPLIVASVDPQQDLAARLTFVDAAPEVAAAGTGTPPATFVSQITGKPWCAAPDTPTITVRAGTSAPNNGGLKHNEGGFSTRPGSGIYRLPSYKLQQLGLLAA